MSTKATITDRAGGNQQTRIASLRISRIKVDNNRREHDDDVVNDMAVSIRDVGLLNPISVTRDGKNNEGKNQYVLVAGSLRLKAAQLLGQKKIDAIVLDRDEDEARLCEIAENLFRDELSVLDRSELITEWLDQWRKEGDHGDHPGGRQPGDRGISKAAKKLKLSRAMVGRAEKIAGIADDVKAAAKEAKLENSTRELLKIAKAKTPEAQLQKIKELRSRGDSKKKRAKNKEHKGTKSGGPELPRVKSPSSWDNDLEVDESEDESAADEVSDDDDFDRLKLAWRESSCVEAWNDATPSSRIRFIHDVLGYSADVSEMDEADND
jgi:ParB-like chromosome segregation protein Spo0J